jgi:hypothetical protein
MNGGQFDPRRLAARLPAGDPSPSYPHFPMEVVDRRLESWTGDGAGFDTETTGFPADIDPARPNGASRLCVVSSHRLRSLTQGM